MTQMPLDQSFLNENMMGPNAWRMAEELTQDLPLRPGMRVLDLGCGRGLTTIYLAKRFGVEVFALDLWTDPSENYERFQVTGVEHLTVPLQIDAVQLPFAAGFFDAVVSIDAHHYFGTSDGYFGEVLRPILKKGAVVAMAFPGMRYEVHEHVPEEMKHLWEPEALALWHSIPWWRPKFEPYLADLQMAEMDCFDAAWQDWLSCENPYAQEDVPMMQADGGRYMNLIKLVGKIPE